MTVFLQEHQDFIDEINHDGWQYIAGRIKQIGENFGAYGGVSGSFLGFKLNAVEVRVDRELPVIDWRIIDREGHAFTDGFRLSVGAEAASTSNHVICKPFDWVVLCSILNIGLNMASLNLAISRANYAPNQ